MTARTKPRSEVDALDRALRLLGSRPHATAELRRKLRQRGYESAEIEAALARLQELGYLDDAAFARSLIGWRSGTRGHRAIASELAARGISRSEAQAALAETDPDAERDAARVLAAKLMAAGGGAADVAKVAPRLRRRGFSEEAVRGALRDLAVESPD